MAKRYPGAMPLTIVHKGKSKNGRPVLACPRPLSRKKLRQLMPKQQRNLSSEALATRYRRKPGGQTGKRLRDQLDHLENAAALEGGENKLDRVTSTMLTTLRRLFTGSAPAKRAVKAAKRGQ